MSVECLALITISLIYYKKVLPLQVPGSAEPRELYVCSIICWFGATDCEDTVSSWVSIQCYSACPGEALCPMFLIKCDDPNYVHCSTGPQVLAVIHKCLHIRSGIGLQFISMIAAAPLDCNMNIKGTCNYTLLLHKGIKKLKNISIFSCKVWQIAYTTTS